MNPGTSEMQFVSALDGVPAVRGVLCLFEGVCSGAADGYARMTGRPAATLLHLGPGLANALANLHNARKARSAVVNIVGEHTTGHLGYDAPLSSDTEAFAIPVSGWVRMLGSATSAGALASEAIAFARTGQVATLIIPADFSWSDGGAPGAKVAEPPPSAMDVSLEVPLDQETGILLGHNALLEPGLNAAARVAAALGARVLLDRTGARFLRGARPFAPPRLAYFPEAAEQQLAGLKHLILVECEPPVSFFGYPNRRSLVAPADCEYHPFPLPALIEFARIFPPAPPADLPPQPPIPEDGPLTADSLGQTLAALLPADAIIADEMISASEIVHRHLAAAPPHEVLPVAGGAIGQGLPVAVGAAIACPDRPVIALEADGSAMYTIQALWTMAREKLNVITIILANHRYRILDIEMRRTGAPEHGPKADAMLDLSRPDLDFVKLAEAQGVPATRAASVAEFADQFRQALAAGGPRLIEAVLSNQ